MKNIASKYRLVYRDIWQTYGQSWFVRISFALQFVRTSLRFVGLPIALSLIIANLSQKNYESAKLSVLLFVTFSLLIGVVSPLIKYIGILGENNIYEKSTGNYFEKLVGSDIDYFNSNLSGYLTTATRQYVDNSIEFVRAWRTKYLVTIFSILLPLIIVFYVDFFLGMITLLIGTLQVIYMFWASRAINHYRSKSRELYKISSGKMADIISNILAVKATAREAEFVRSVKDNAQKEAISFTERYILQSKLIVFREIISVIFFMILLWLVVERSQSSVIELAGAILVVTYASIILTGIYTLSEDLDDHDNYIDKIIPAFEVINRDNSIKDPMNPVVLDSIKGDINIQNIGYSYIENSSSNPVFSDFSLFVPHGQKLGIVGLSGAGKTTLTKLLLRFDDVKSGKISIDEVDIKDLAQKQLRSNIAYVPQEPLLFHTSIKNNVLFGQQNASDKEIKDALAKAHAWSFVSILTNGMDSVVGERGVKLSGGQKQRVAIARAVLQKTPIIILDEATSALDSESEQIIKQSFAEILRNKTAIIVAHRLSTLSEMDRIIVIDGGKLKEDGTHEELLAAGGLYSKLWKHQQRIADL